MTGIKSNKTRKIIITVVVAIALVAIVNILMWRASFADESDWPIVKYSSYVNGTDTWDVPSRFHNELDKNHTATEKQKVKYHSHENFFDEYDLEIRGVYMTVDRSYITVHYKTWENASSWGLFSTYDLSFEMIFTVFDADGNKIDEFTETTEKRKEMHDDKDYDKMVFHANGGKDGSDFRTPEKPVTVICNELVDKGIITKEFADKTSLEELIKCGYVKVKFTKIHSNFREPF